MLLAVVFGFSTTVTAGESPIAIQNGSRPHRVIAIELAENGLSVVDVRVLAGKLPEDLEGPVILRTAL